MQVKEIIKELKSNEEREQDYWKYYDDKPTDDWYDVATTRDAEWTGIKIERAVLLLEMLTHTIHFIACELQNLNKKVEKILTTPDQSSNATAQ